MKTCYQCGTPIRKKSDEVQTEDGAVVHQECLGAYQAEQRRERAAKSGGSAWEPKTRGGPKKGDVIVTTLPSVANRHIEYEIDVVGSEAVYGMNVFRDFTAAMRDFVGGRSGGTQKVLKGCRETALKELKEQAEELGADAVVGVDLDFSEFSGQGKSMLFVVATGTAVKLKT